MLNPLLFILILGFPFFASCEKDDDVENENETETNTTTDLAPIKIIGKELVLYNSKMQYTLQASAFASNNTCKVPMLASSFSLTNTPTFNYSKITANSASLEVKYAYKLQIGKDYTNTSETYTTTLSFTCSTGGTYIGSEKSVSTGNVSALNGTSTRTISGSFSLY